MDIKTQNGFFEFLVADTNELRTIKFEKFITITSILLEFYLSFIYI